MRANPVRAKLKRGEPVFGMMLTEFDNPALAKLLADAGFDYFVCDLEHSAFSLQATAHVVQMARLANIVPLVRVPDGMYHLIAPVLDVGAQGIVVPRVETREVAEGAIAAMRYPPLGRRGIFIGKGNSDYVPTALLEYTRHANENLLAIIQIESKTAVERADELLSTPGLDAVLVGPWDLALSLGVEANDPLVEQMAWRVVEVAQRHNVASGIHMGDPAQIKLWQARGMTLLSCLTDLELMRHAAHALRAALR